MSKVSRFLKFTPIFLATLGVLLISGAFLNKPQTQNSKNQATIGTNSPQIAGEKASLLQSPELSQAQTVKVSRVVDGDTIELESGQKVRYIGINTPETVHPTKPVECFGREASAKNKELVEGKNVELVKDVSETDKYGRLLRYVYIDGTFVNDYLIRQGFASSSTYPPDIKYQDQFRQAEEEARQNNRGLWAACPGGANQPATISDQSTTAESSANGCTIKGNISSGGKIYHMPGQYYYNKTQIDESRGEKWFCTEAEAINAGWRKSLK